MKNENFIVIQGWMVNELGLKQNDLLVYAIIYGFSQAGESKCVLSLNYFQKSLNVSKNTILKSINFLSEKGLIFKEQNEINKITYNSFFVNKKVVQELNNNSSENARGVVQKLVSDSSEIEHNNINKNNIENKESNPVLFPENEIGLPIQVLNYLNEKKPSKIPFNAISQNLTDIKKRIKEKYQFEDFKKVVDYKVNEWANDKKMKKYIRPETLFGNKFDGYLVQAQEGNFSKDGSENFELHQTEKADLI